MISPINPSNSIMANVRSVLQRISPTNLDSSSIRDRIHADKFIDTNREQKANPDAIIDQPKISDKQLLHILDEIKTTHDTENVLDTTKSDIDSNTGIINDIGNTSLCYQQDSEFGMQTYDENGFLEFDKEYLSYEAITDRKKNAAKLLDFNRDPLDPDVVAWRSDSNLKHWEGSLAGFIADSIGNVAVNNYAAYALANELSSLISSTANRNNNYYDPDRFQDGIVKGVLTEQKSAANREMGMKLAEYLAENFIDDPEEAQSFIKRISQEKWEAEMKDKGYYIYNGSAVKGYGMVDGHITWGEMKKRFFSEVDELALFQQGNDVVSAFMQYIAKNSAKFESIIIKEFEEHEKAITDIIRNTIVDSNIYEDNIERYLGALTISK